ncbi:MAG: M24 family metallopeptidase [Rhodocyclaceae bacterium]|nr:MAG: M24 family metallopeptidase [Rhodocyclaceae bacterium]
MTATFDPAPFLARRQRLQETMAQGVAVIPTAPEQVRNRDAHFPFRSDSYFHYLSGFPEPEAVIVLVAGDAPKSILFCRDKDMEREIWDGYRYGPAAAKEVFAFDEAHSITELEAKLPELIANQPLLWTALGFDPAWDNRITAALNVVRGQSRAGKRAPETIRNVRAPLDAMRLVKDAFELDIMGRAARISAGAHRRAMQFIRPGRNEYEVEAELLHEFRRQGSPYPAYTSIVAAGAHACVLHYVENNGPIADGDLVLIDAGCELEGYASDITRSFPANGRFSGPQKDIYQLVLDAQYAAEQATRPGATFMAPHDAALKVLVQGLLDLKLISGTSDEALEKESYKRFYMHRTSHWLGMDVHDAGEYKDGEQWKTLQAGMVLTLEPGCYIRPGDDVPEAFWNIGVRIEDDAVVTANGCELITQDAPKTVAEIEALMQDARS